PMFGAFFMTFLLEYLRPVLPGSERYLVYGLIALVLYVYQPKGIHRIIEDLRKGMGGRGKGAADGKAA
ncbi:MAG TPA: hypothetical protein PKE65_10385, partial [Rhizobiaceae bacterium]|nr:hypothetical protein [Rhizobiaceae bacterium]